MNVRTKVLWPAVGLVILISGVWAWRHSYVGPKSEVQARIDDTKANIAALESTLREQSDLDKRGKKVAATTLGSQIDVLHNRFRAGLSRIGEEQGLTGLVVDDGVPMDQPSPVLSAKGVPSSMKQALRRATDFQVVRGSIKGVGTLDQVLNAVAVIQAQPWVHRVEGFSIRPVGKERDKFDVRVDVATLFIPDLAAKAELDPKIAPAPPEAEAMWRAVASKNVFRRAVPAPGGGTEVAHVSGPGQPAPAQVFAPYEDWKLTGIFVGGRGSEAFFTNIKTGAKVTVERGGQVLDAVFIEGAGEKAVLEIGGKRFEVSNGQTLAARRPQV